MCYAIVDDVISSELLDRVENELEPWIQASDAGRDEYDGAFTRRTGSLIERSPAARALTEHQVADAQAEMRRGSLLFYDGKVLQGINITYAVGWVRQEENQYLGCSPEVARPLDDDLLKMMGYQQGAFALGYVGDQQDPLSKLWAEERKVKVTADITQRHDDHRQFVRELKEGSVVRSAPVDRSPDAGATPSNP